jgi:aminopeptidase 2
MYIFSGLGTNRATRRGVTVFFKENYAEVGTISHSKLRRIAHCKGLKQILKRFEGNFSLSYIIKFIFESYTTEEDAQDTEAFFKVYQRLFIESPTG